MSGFGLFPLPGNRNDDDINEDSPKWQTPKKYEPSKFMQCRQLGQLDPALYMNEETEDLYEQPPGHVGRLWFSLSYRKAVEQLTVIILKARNLRVKKEGGFGIPGDCYTKVSLEQDERRIHTTSVKKKTNNPTFNETFCLQIPFEELVQQNLRFSVFHVDRHKRHKAIGYISYNLQQLDTSGKELRLYRDLDMNSNSEVTDIPEVLIALTNYPALERLTVGIFEGKNLPQKEDGTSSEIFVKVGLHFGLQGKEIKVKKTDLFTSGQSLNESFSFNKVTDFDQTSVRLSVTQHSSSIGLFDKPLGFIVLGSELFAKRKELEHWKEMLERPEEQVTYWHQIQQYA